VLAEGALAFLVQFVGVSDLGDAAHRNLGWQSELLAQSAVGQDVDAVLPELLSLPRDLGHKLAGEINALYRLDQSRTLCVIGQQLHFGTDQHWSFNLAQRRFLRTPEGGGFRAAPGHRTPEPEAGRDRDMEAEVVRHPVARLP
jgi:hypothetical protein